MDTQDKFARRLAARLDESLDTLPPGILARLEQARESALEQTPRSNHGVFMVGGNVLAAAWHTGKSKIALMGIAIALALAGAAAQYKAIQSAAVEAADIDETILSDQAPVQSYLDPGFAAVLRAGVALRPESGE